MAEQTSDYNQRAAKLVERLRNEIGFGYGINDIEHIGEIVVARIRAWDKLDQEKIDRVESKKISKYLRGIGLVNVAKDIETGEYER